MRTLILSDSAAAELESALSASKPVIAPPQPAPPPPSIPAPAAGVRVVELDWQNPSRIIVAASCADIIAVKFTTGPHPSPAGNLPKIVAAEYGAPPRERRSALSSMPGLFAASLSRATSGTTVTIPFSVGPNNTGYYPALQPNTAYFLNIMCADQSETGPADMFVELHKPGSGY